MGLLYYKHAFSSRYENIQPKPWSDFDGRFLPLSRMGEGGVRGMK